MIDEQVENAPPVDGCGPLVLGTGLVGALERHPVGEGSGGIDFEDGLGFANGCQALHEVNASQGDRAQLVGRDTQRPDGLAEGPEVLADPKVGRTVLEPVGVGLRERVRSGGLAAGLDEGQERQWPPEGTVDAYRGDVFAGGAHDARVGRRPVDGLDARCGSPVEDAHACVARASGKVDAKELHCGPNSRRVGA